jgi:transposase InsO family protein
MADNAFSHRRSQLFQHALTDAGIRHLHTRPYRPQTSGKAERFNQTLINEWTYYQPCPTNQTRLDSLQD